MRNCGDGMKDGGRSAGTVVREVAFVASVFLTRHDAFAIVDETYPLCILLWLPGLATLAAVRVV